MGGEKAVMMAESRVSTRLYLPIWTPMVFDDDPPRERSSEAVRIRAKSGLRPLLFGLGRRAEKAAEFVARDRVDGRRRHVVRGQVLEQLLTRANGHADELVRSVGRVLGVDNLCEEEVGECL